VGSIESHPESAAESLKGLDLSCFPVDPEKFMLRPGQNTIRIALADDHTIFRDGLRQLLDAEPDFSVVGEARDGVEALEVVRGSKPDILLLDLKMPALDGLGVLRQLAVRRSKTQVIVLTSSDDTQEHAEAIKLGAAAVTLKRDSTDTLLSAIRSVYRGEAPAPAPPTNGAELQPDPDLPLTSREREIAHRQLRD